MKKYHFPIVNEVFPDESHRIRKLQRLRYRLRILLNYPLVKQFEEIINQKVELIDILHKQQNSSYPLVCRFLDKRFFVSKRLDLMLDNLEFIPKICSNYNLTPIWQEKLLLGVVAENFEIYLNFNTNQPMEGFLALELRYKPTNEIYYALTFGKIDNALLIASLQGSNKDDAKDTVKLLTKNCFGLRPGYLLIEIMKMLTKAWEFKKLLGIPHKYQNKSRFIESKRYTVNYDNFFKESGGVLGRYWDLGLELDTDLSDIASKKRSMYKKRFAMLAEIENNIKNIFQKNGGKA